MNDPHGIVCRLALGQQFLLTTNERRDLVAKHIEVSLALGLADQRRHVVHGVRIADLATQRDLRLGHVRLPGVQDLRNLAQPFHLRRVVTDDLLKFGDLLIGGLLSTLVRIEKRLLAGQKIAAHAGFHINGRGKDAICLAEHFVSVLYPARYVLGL